MIKKKITYEIKYSMFLKLISSAFIFFLFNVARKLRIAHMAVGIAMP